MHPLQSGCLNLGFALTGVAYPVGRQDRLFYFLSFLLSRKARSAINIVPKAISNPRIPRNTVIISKSVITHTSLLFISDSMSGYVSLGGSHPVMGAFPAAYATGISYHLF